MAPERLTEVFVKALAEIERVTEGNPDTIVSAATKHRHVMPLLEKLDFIHRAVESQKKQGKNIFIVQAHDGFKNALKVYNEKWINAYTSVMLKDIDISFLTDGLPKDQVFAAEDDMGVQDDDYSALEVSLHQDDVEFDPNWHRADKDIRQILEACEWKAEEKGLGFFGRGTEAFSWLEAILGTKFCDVQDRWTELDLWVVKKTVSDKHAVGAKSGLYGYLSQATVCYLVAADLAAIALCRTAIELILKSNYFCCGPGQDSKYKHLKLGKIIERLVEIKPELKTLNLSTLLSEANNIVHANPKFGNPSDNLKRQIAKKWIGVLHNIIQQAPEKPEVYVL